MKRNLFLMISTVVIVAMLFAGSVGTVASQTATATATPCPTTTPASTEAATVPPTLSAAATAEATAVATPDLSDVNAFATFAAQLAQSPHQTVRSADGKVALLIPPGALPSNIPLSKLKINALNPQTAPTIGCTRPLLAYQLSPDGLRFVTPAVVVLTIDPPKGGTMPLLWSVSGQAIEPLSPILHQTDPKSHRLVITASIAHFSDLEAGGSKVDVTLSISGSQHAVGDPFGVTASVTRPTIGDLPPVKWGLEPSWSAFEHLSSGVYLHFEWVVQDTYTATQQFQCTSPTLGTSIFFGARYRADFNLGLSSGTVTVNGYVLASAPIVCVPLATKLDVTFVRPVTTYTVTANDPDGDTLSYTWSNSNTEANGQTCGVFTSSGNVATWSHPDSNLPGACPNEDVHPGTVSVKVTENGHGATQVVNWVNGSAPGILNIK